jgi:hypothetical protein
MKSDRNAMAIPLTVDDRLYSPRGGERNHAIGLVRNVEAWALSPSRVAVNP